MQRRRHRASPRCWIREETGRSRPLGRALDLGCGRGLYTPEPARRGGEAVGIDYVPAAIEAAAAKSRGAAGLSYIVGDVTQLPSADLGTLDFFPRHRLLPGSGHRTASGPGERYLGVCQPRGHTAHAELRSEPVAMAGRRGIARGGRDRLRGLGDARVRVGRHRGPGLADEHDRAAVAQVGPDGLWTFVSSFTRRWVGAPGWRNRQHGG
ncbi:MAG TPA: methyltransferase domain-containing protein [Trebonia sp.]|nr:methyltransferase domain-containing protein [Trebonia sp.]